ncbi:MAG: serine/threonine protein kinase [Planctomyces sp.]|nr:serine/threonine protein kinase [Planctomyces sp.]
MADRADHPQSEKEILLEALSLTPECREAFLDKACGDQRALRIRIESLLRHAVADSEFMATPVTTIDSARNVRQEAIGTRIGHYQLTEQLGEGGMGIVYVAEQVEPVRRMVAVKLIKPGMDTHQVIARFEAERQALAIMDHPNIARVLDAGATDRGLPYFVMELVRGHRITEYCDKARLSTAERLRLFIAVCGAVHHAHLKGIIHRDLKPSNILVTLQDGVPIIKVIDFGIAKALNQEPSEFSVYTTLNQILGTPLYMSPEQLELKGFDIDIRTDVYSLGVLLYELLTGVLPFDREELFKSGFDEMRRIIREKDAPRPSQRMTTLDEESRTTNAMLRGLDNKALARTIRGELDWIVMKALEKDRNRRYDTASALADDIQRYLNHERVNAHPPSRWYRFQKFARRNRGLLVTATMFFAAITVGLVGTSLQTVRARNAEARSNLLLQREINLRLAAETQSRRADEESKRAIRGEQKAIEEESRAQAILDFLLNDLLAFSSVEIQYREMIDGPKLDLPVHALLDRAAPLVEQRFSDRPWTAGSIHFVLGKSYDSLGDTAKAEAHLRKAVEIGRADIGEDHPGSHRASVALSKTLTSRGQFAEADALLANSLRFYSESGTPEDVDAQEAMMALIYLRFEQGRSHEVLDTARELVDLRTKLYGEEDERTLAAKGDLAAQYGRTGRHQLAIELRLKIVEVLEKRLAPADPVLLSNLSNLAALYFEEERFVMAESLLRRVIDGYSQHGHARSRDLIVNQISLARVMIREENLAAADRLVEPWRHDTQQSLDERDPIHLLMLDLMQEYYLNRGETENARAIFEQRSELVPAVFGEQSREYISLIQESTRLWLRLNKPQEAETAFAKSVELAKLQFGPDHRLTRSCINNYGVHLYSMRRYQEAEQLFNSLIANRGSEGISDEVQFLRALRNLSSVQIATQRLSEARATLQRAVDHADQTVGLDHNFAAMCRVELSDLIVKDLDDPSSLPAAVSLLQQAVATYSETDGPHSRVCMATKCKLAKTLFQGNQTTEAESVLETVYQTALEDLGADHPAVGEARNQVSGVYTSWKMPERALSMRQRYYQDMAGRLGEEASLTQDAFQNYLYSVSAIEMERGKAESLARKRLETLSAIAATQPDVLNRAKLAVANQIAIRLNRFVDLEEDETSESTALLEEALRLCDEITAVPSPDPAIRKTEHDAIRTKVKVLLAMDRLEPAEEAQRRLISYLRADSVAVRELLTENSRLIKILLECGKLTEAESLAWDSLQVAKVEDDQQMRISIASILIQCQLAAPSPANAEKTENEATAVLGQSGPQNLLKATLQVNLAMLHQVRQQTEQANRSIEDLTSTQGINVLPDLKRKMALIYRSQRRDDDAEALLRSALANSGSLPDSSVVQAVRHDLAGMLIDSGKFEEAELLLKDVQAKCHRHSARSWRCYSTMCMLGVCRSAQSEFVEAEILFRDGLTGLKAKLTNGDSTWLERAIVYRRACSHWIEHLKRSGHSEEIEHWEAELKAWELPPQFNSIQ